MSSKCKRDVQVSVGDGPAPFRIDVDFDLDLERLYAHYLVSCATSGVTPVSRERADGVVTEWQEVCPVDLSQRSSSAGYLPPYTESRSRLLARFRRPRCRLPRSAANGPLTTQCRHRRRSQADIESGRGID